MKKNELLNKINNGEFDAKFAELYGDRAGNRKDDILNGIEKFCDMYGDERDVFVYSVPGRTELSGNHTDHNHGKVIASSIDLDIIAVVSPRNDSKVNLKSEGFRENRVDLDKFTKPDDEFVGHSESLIAGVADVFRKNGRKVCGFDAYTTSDVLRGSGMSSSAAFEVMIGNIFSNLCNDGKVGAIEIAKASQYAENVFFGKPCGLMDQLACAVGGIISVDFENEKEPIVEKVDFDLSEYGYRLCMVDTGGSHDDLTEDYASVPAEMKAVAAYFGKKTLREVSEDEFSAKAAKLRRAVGDRAVLRAMHFFGENKRVEKQINALKNKDLDGYFELVKESGRSSCMYLQNGYSTKSPKEQGIMLALCVCDKFFENREGAYRLHGGGFAGTVQAYVKKSDCDAFKRETERFFGEGSCKIIEIRKYGAIEII